MRTVRKRRMQRKTDYKNRFLLLRSPLPRLIARKTNRYLIAQIVESNQAQDRVIIGITSKFLLKKGWKTPLISIKNKEAAYLTGFMIAKLSLKKNIRSVVFDIGMHRNVHKSKLYALLKGAIDAGLKIPSNSEILPQNNILKNEEIKEILNKMTKE